MPYSYTQISQYLTCPRRYRYRYLDGWKEKDTRPAMLFGRVFEQALGAYFRREDPGDILFREWSVYKDVGLHFLNNDTWDRMLEQGIMLLTRFCQDDRVRIYQPRRNLQIKFTRQVDGNNEFVAYIDGVGKLDGKRCLLEWKTSSNRFPVEPEGLLALDPQLVCYSWMTGIAEVAQVVFVRKRLVDIQYLRTTITEKQRQEFGHLVEDTVRESSRPSFCPTAAFAFPRTLVPAARMSGFVLQGRISPRTHLYDDQEQKTLVGLTSLITRNPPMPPKLNRRRALFVLTKIDEILVWEQQREMERDTKFVELGRYLCEVRAGQYWRLEKQKSFDEFLETRFPGSRRKAYYLMSIHEHLPPQARKELKEIGWTKGLELAKVARRDGQDFDYATWMHRARAMPKEQFRREVEKELTGRDTEPWEIIYFKLYKPDSGH